MRDPQTLVAYARLRQDCILAKEALSVDTETVLPVFLPGRHFDVRITRSDFENMVRARSSPPSEHCRGPFTQLRWRPTDLSAVLLVGGSSRIPLVAQMVAAELGCPTVVDTHPKHAVALGAATLAAQPAPIPTPTVPANTVFGAPHQQRDDQKQDDQTPMPSNGLAKAIPEQRTPHRKATVNFTRSTLGVGATRPDARTVRTPAPAPQPRAAQRSAPAGTLLSDDRDAGSGAGRPSFVRASRRRPSPPPASISLAP